jgi:hypothetical protein
MSLQEERQKLSLNLKNPNMKVATLISIARRYAKQFNMNDKLIVQDLTNSSDVETLIQKFDGYFKDYINLKR